MQISKEDNDNDNGEGEKDEVLYPRRSSSIRSKESHEQKDTVSVLCMRSI